MNHIIHSSCVMGFYANGYKLHPASPPFWAGFVSPSRTDIEPWNKLPNVCTWSVPVAGIFAFTNQSPYERVKHARRFRNKRAFKGSYSDRERKFLISAGLINHGHKLTRNRHVFPARAARLNAMATAQCAPNARNVARIVFTNKGELAA